ncbi:MAG: hypothetical protein ACI9JR_002633 [Gammaproteobacteria bacterium]
MFDSIQQHQYLIHIFRQYLANELVIVDAIGSYGKSFHLSHDNWQFTLPDLFEFCSKLNPGIATLEYLQFRRLLYQFPTNQIIAGDGGKFELIDNLGHVDRNIYALIRH